MKALTLTQPWASLVAAGLKRIETRSWTTSYRGPLAIHAAKGFAMTAQRVCWENRAIAETLPRIFGHNPIDETTGAGASTGYQFPLGVVVATCELADVLPIYDAFTFPKLPLPTPYVWRWGDGALGIVRERNAQAEFIREPERSFGDYTPSRYAWILAHVKALPEPVLTRGALGLWEWTP